MQPGAEGIFQRTPEKAERLTLEKTPLYLGGNMAGGRGNRDFL